MCEIESEIRKLTKKQNYLDSFLLNSAFDFLLDIIDKMHEKEYNMS